ncbi:MAG: hypothetical protein EOS07_34525 [Mesorhizobium sp.]|nr:MAG: hypothetical protein EOS07_34525 [Mesorhizobium sp.]
MNQATVDEYTSYIQRKEVAFRDIVSEPANHFIDLFWARMLPYLSKVRPNSRVNFTIKLRNNLERTAVYSAHLLMAHGWNSDGRTESISLQPGQRGEIILGADAPSKIDPRRRLISAEVLIDGISQGPICEALISVSGGIL